MDRQMETPTKWDDLTEEEKWAQYCARMKQMKDSGEHILTAEEQNAITRKVKQSTGAYFRMLREDAARPISAETFKQALSGRVATKSLLKVNHHRDQVTEYLTMAYRRRVEADNRIFEPSNEMLSKILAVAGWMIDGKHQGLILRGGVGVGKSTMMRAIADVYYILDKRTTLEVSALDVARAGKDDDKLFRRYCEAEMLAIDDLGTEHPTLRSYGNEVSPMAELITERHKRLAYTVVTTNLVVTEEGYDQIAERYGERVYDRLCELCGIMKYSGAMKSYR